ncbi:hypothetical protein C8Q80DRAFT_38635 [Daedaleopsis nitida]|nr:hypothetical protein C8Q80DRAFT_38635 [Daedaleopsis nitida]
MFHSLVAPPCLLLLLTSRTVRPIKFPECVPLSSFRFEFRTNGCRPGLCSLSILLFPCSRTSVVLSLPHGRWHAQVPHRHHHHYI